MYLPGARFTPEKILLSQNRFSMTFSDADMGELIEFYNAFAFMKYKPYSMNQNSMKLMSLKAQRIPEIKRYRTYYKDEECVNCSKPQF